MPGRPPALISLCGPDFLPRETMDAPRATPHGLLTRAKIVLMSADGRVVPGYGAAFPGGPESADRSARAALPASGQLGAALVKRRWRLDAAAVVGGPNQS